MVHRCEAGAGEGEREGEREKERKKEREKEREREREREREERAPVSIVNSKESVHKFHRSTRWKLANAYKEI